MTWQGWLTVERNTDNLGQNNWVALIEIIKELRGIGRDSFHQLQHRHCLDPYGFWYDTGEVDEEGNPILQWYGNTVLYAANFATDAVQFDKFANKLERAFGLPAESVTVTTEQVTHAAQPSVKGAFIYNAKVYFYVTLLGCASDDSLATPKASHLEALAMVAAGKALWEPSS